VSEKLGDKQTARTYTESIKAVGLKLTPRQLARDQREVYQKALWKLARKAKTITIEFPVKAGGTRTAVFETGGVDASRMPNWWN